MYTKKEKYETELTEGKEKAQYKPKKGDRAKKMVS